MIEAKALLAKAPRAELLNVFHAEQAGSDIITVTNDVLEKLANVGKDLATFALETSGRRGEGGGQPRRGGGEGVRPLASLVRHHGFGFGIVMVW